MMKTKTFFSIVAIALLIMSAGCSGLTGGGGPAKQTPTPKATPTATPESAPTTAATPEATPEAIETTTPEPVVTESDSDELTKAEKFEEFDENIRYLYRVSNRSKYLKGTKAFPENDTYHLTVEMRDTTNRTKTVNDRTNPLWKYSAIVDDYNNNDNHLPERDHTYIPDRFNITFVTEDGEVFQTYYIKYTWAWKHSTGDWSLRVLLGKYGSTEEEGPAYHEKWK